MIIFLIAEVTAVSLLVKYLSGNDLWITSLIVLSCSIIYTLYGGLRISISILQRKITDKIQFIFFTLILVLINGFSISFFYSTRPF